MRWSSPLRWSESQDLSVMQRPELKQFRSPLLRPSSSVQMVFGSRCPGGDWLNYLLRLIVELGPEGFLSLSSESWRDTGSANGSWNCSGTHMYTHAHTDTHIHAHAHTHIHTHTHTHTHTTFLQRLYYCSPLQTGMRYFMTRVGDIFQNSETENLDMDVKNQCPP